MFLNLLYASVADHRHARIAHLFASMLALLRARNLHLRKLF